MSEHSFQPPDQSNQGEIARLRAEVERFKIALRRSTDDFVQPTVEKLERERDEARAALNDAKKALKIMNQNLDDLSRAKQEALAQVAVLLQRLREEHCQSESCDLHTIPYVEARALLDRLAMLEDGAMTNQRLVWLEDRLRRREALIEELRATLENAEPGFLTRSVCLLAAWEEGKMLNGNEERSSQ